jgi:hypothetical protein
MGGDACHQIFASLQHNTNLWSLEVCVDDVFDDEDVSLILPTNTDSALRRLGISVNRWTLEGRATLAKQLKTNTSLESLHVGAGSGPQQQHVVPPPGDCAWVGMLESYQPHSPLLGGAARRCRPRP